MVRFGVFEADLRSGELRKSGVRIKLRDRAFQVLTELLEHPGEVVTREELRDRLWPDGTFVDFDHSLNAAVDGRLVINSYVSLPGRHFLEPDLSEDSAGPATGTPGSPYRGSPTQRPSRNGSLAMGLSKTTCFGTAKPTSWRVTAPVLDLHRVPTSHRSSGGLPDTWFRDVISHSTAPDGTAIENLL